MKKNINAVNVGLSGFPYGSAAVNRCLNIYSGLSGENFKIHIINYKAVHKPEIPVALSKRGVFRNITYEYTTPSPYKPDNFFKRRYYKFIGRTNEIYLILKLGINKKIDVMFYYPQGNLFDLMVYRLFSKLFGFPLIAHYVEYRSSFDNRKKILLRVNDILFDKYFMFLVEGVLPISNFLINEIKKRRNNLPVLKILPVVDFNLFTKPKKNKKVNYFLYVGAIGYTKSLEIILDSFELINNNEYYLYLILHGGSNKEISVKIKNHPKKDLIKVFSNLKYSELIQYNIDANALLIPLSNNIKDIARFPNKISEYLASANPIITTNFGEIKYYFKDCINALVAEKNKPKYFSKKMDFVINHPEKAKEIGKNGYDTGLKYFDNSSYKVEIIDFVLKLI